MSTDRTHKKGASALLRKPWVQSVSVIVIVFGALAGVIVWHTKSTQIFIETSVLDAPIASIAPTSGGTLNALYVKEGDHVESNTPIAQIGTETLFVKESGVVLGKPQVIGSYFGAGQKVLSVVDAKRMRVVGTMEETEGLAKVQKGQRVVFTVDAFPGVTYEGIVDDISPASNDAGIAFSISDKRPVKKFNIYATFDTDRYPELLHGMSAKMTIYLK